MDFTQQKIVGDVSGQDLINGLNILQDTFTALGIIGIDPCDYEGSAKKIVDLVEERLKSIKEICSKFLAELGDKAIATVGLLLLAAELLATNLIALLINLIAEGVSKFVGLINSLVMYVLSAVKGIIYIIQYFALKFLKSLIEERIIILNKIEEQTEFLKSYLTLLDFNNLKTNNDSGNTLKQVNDLLKQIVISINTEVNKNNVINHSKLININSTFETIFKLLTKNNSTQLFEDLKILIEDLKEDDPSLFNFSEGEVLTNIGGILNKVATALNRKYLSIPADGADFKIKIRQSFEKLKVLLNNVSPEISSLITTILLYDTFNERLKTFSRLVPLLSGSLEITDLYKDRTVNKYTLYNLNSSIDLSEVLIVNFNYLWSAWAETSDSIRKDILINAREKITKIMSEIDSDILQNKDDFFTKMGYYTKLQEPYISIKSLTSNYDIALPGIKSLLVNPGLTISTIDKARIKLNDISKFIVEKNIDPSTKKVKRSYAQQIYLLSKNMVGPLLLNIGILLFDNERRLLIQKLQSVTLLIGKQKNQDFIELSKINDYINTMDSIPEFVALKALIEKFLSENSSNGLGSALLKGDLAAVTNIVGLAQAGLDAASLFTVCNKNKNSFALLDLLPTSDLPGTAELKKITAIIEDAKTSVININNQKISTDILSNTISEYTA